MKIGAVSYLNTKPLIRGAEQWPEALELVLDLPSRLADQLAAGDLDIALIPSFEYFRDPAYTIVSDACIGCRGPVLSVKLFSRVPVSKIRTLALDEGSRTSAALVQVLLAEKCGVRPALQPLPIPSQWEAHPADALLVIGDRAMHPPRTAFAEVWDLGDVWSRWAELPFVFAMWVARPGVDWTGVDGLLSQARDRGLAEVDQIAAEEAPRYGLTTALCRDYFTRKLHFQLTSRELAGLRKYYELCVAHGLTPAGAVLPDYIHLS